MPQVSRTCRIGTQLGWVSSALAKFHDAPVCMLPIIVSMRVTMALVGVKWMPVVVFLELISSAGDLSMMSLGLFAP